MPPTSPAPTSVMALPTSVFGLSKTVRTSSRCTFQAPFPIFRVAHLWDARRSNPCILPIPTHHRSPHQQMHSLIIRICISLCPKPSLIVQLILLHLRFIPVLQLIKAAIAMIFLLQMVVCFALLRHLHLVLRAKKKNDLDRVMGLYGSANERYW